MARSRAFILRQAWRVVHPLARRALDFALAGGDCWGLQFGYDIWDAINFVGGLLNAYGSDNALGVGRQQQDTTAGKVGVAVGDTVAGIQGVEQALGGGGAALALVPADGTPLAPVAALAQVGAVAIAVQGAATAAVAGGNLLKSAIENSSNEKPYESTPQNKERMQQGKAPIGKDGHSVERHHEGQNPSGPIRDMTKTQHRLGENFKKNHPNTGQQPSRINRNQAQQQRKNYWKGKVKQED